MFKNKTGIELWQTFIGLKNMNRKGLYKIHPRVTPCSFQPNGSVSQRKGFSSINLVYQVNFPQGSERASLAFTLSERLALTVVLLIWLLSLSLIHHDKCLAHFDSGRHKAKSAEEWNLGEVQSLLLQSSHIISLTHSLYSFLKMVGLFAPLFLSSIDNFNG